MRLLREYYAKFGNFCICSFTVALMGIVYVKCANNESTSEIADSKYTTVSFVEMVQE